MRRALLALLLAAPAAAAPTKDELIDRGLHALYDFDFAASREAFRTLRESFPDNAIGPYAEATALWWELTNEYDESNPALEKDFLDATRRAADAARALIKTQGDPTGESHLCLGGALGLEARWEAINGQWISAYRHGRQAFKDQKEAIRLNPEMYDAYLGVGIFHYYTATLPAVVKVLAKLIFGGNKQQGLDEIKIAMEKGRFSKTAARLFMVGILVNNEHDPARALALVREGRRERPASPFFHLLEMLVLEETKDWDDLRQEAEDFLELLEKRHPLYGPQYAHRALFSLGNASLGRGEPEEALAVYDRVLKEFPGGDRWITMTYLNRGRALDRLGRREEALAAYREVLRRRDVWELHDKAKAYMKNPDKP